jgi:hypothetical protein
MLPFCRQDRWCVRRTLVELRVAVNRSAEHGLRKARPLLVEMVLPRRQPAVRRRRWH